MTSIGLPSRPRSHVLEEECRRFVQRTIPAEWTIQQPKDDYGVDFRVEVFEHGHPSGDEFLVQLKATDRLKTSETSVMCPPVRTSTLRYYLLSKLPVLLLAYDANNKRGYWLWIKEYVRHQLELKNPTWSDQQTVSVVIPAENVFDDKAISAIRAYLAACRARSNLPPRERFVAIGSRKSALRDLRSSLARRMGTWLLTVEGIGGIGKTALVLEAAHGCLEDGVFEGCAWIAARAKDRPIGGLDEGSFTANTFQQGIDRIARVLGKTTLGDVPRGERIHLLAEILRAGRYLVIIDNVENSRDWQMYARLRSLLGPSKLLFTSRVSAGTSDCRILLSGVDLEEGSALLNAEGTQQNVSSLLGANAEQLSQIHTATGGIPLGMKWVVGQLAVSGDPISRVLARFRNPRARALDFILKTSVEALSPDARALLASASGFVGPFTGAAIHHCSGLSGHSHARAINELANSRLVQHDIKTDRYAMASPARHYASTLFASDRARQSTQSRLSEYYLRLGQECGNEPSRFGTVESELANILESIRRDRKAGRYSNIVEMTFAIGYPGFMFIRGYWDELDGLLRVGSEAAGRLRKNEQRATLLLNAAWIAFCRSRFPAALKYISKARGLLAGISGCRARNRVKALAWDYEGQVAGAKRDYNKAEILLHRSLALSEREKEFKRQAVTLHNLGTIADFRGQSEDALHYFQRSLGLKMKLRVAPNSIAIALLALATVRRKRKEYVLAKRALEKMAEIVRKGLNDKRLSAFYWHERARLEYATGRGEPLVSAQNALKLYESLSSRRDILSARRTINTITEGGILMD